MSTSTTDTSTTTTETTATTSTTSTSTTDTSTTSTTTTTSTTSSTSTTSRTTTSSSTSSSSTSTSSSTSSTSTSSTSSTSITSTSTTTSTSSTTSTTTTTGEESVTVTVQIPVVTKDNAGFIGLALGLGIPLLAALSGLFYYSCCRRECSSQKYFNNQSDGRVVQGNQTAIESNEISNDSKDKNGGPIENKQPDYRTEYIKIGNDENQTILPIEEPPSAPENSFACVSISDFELNTLNATTTSFFSPSTNTLPNDHVQQIQETSKNTILSKSMGSVLVRAYSQQEKNKLSNSQKKCLFFGTKENNKIKDRCHLLFEYAHTHTL